MKFGVVLSSFLTNALLLTVGSASCLAFDIDPYTYMQAPDGTTSMQFLQMHRETTNFTFSGAATPYTKAGNAKDSSANTDMTYAHYTGFFDVGGVMVDPHVIVPYASVYHTKLNGYDLQGATGWGDPMLAVVIAPIHAPDNSQVLGLGLGTYLPIGQYEPGRTITIGSNRWQSVIQLAGVQEITPHWSFSGSIDTTFYGNNDQAGTTGKQMETQLNSYQIQPWLRYKPTSELSIALGYSQIYGGKQFLNGIQDGLETDVRQIRMDMALALAEHVFVAVQLDRDIAVDGGYRESFRLCNRLTVLF